ncbi:hypothetical protein OS493_025664 [Desmophyllum pertusum]|uniref:CUB domain-containing protein n=1 Tax=Desmophyllum pertusum TaxID=174260 RepID=A0A9W9ZZ39_9CNID|nr:hypothetical protein OS493_025664 [Desmophyllum pertusum]
MASAQCMVQTKVSEIAKKNQQLSGDKGNFTSPGGYKGYPNDTLCSWVIKANYNAKIEVTFHDFNLELSKTCSPYDYVKVSDKCNKSKTWSDNLPLGPDNDGYCGNMTSFTVTSRCAAMRVEFKSDDSITGKGFNATYEVIPVPKKCKCPKVIIANWYDIPPYIKDNGPGRKPSGLFPLLLQEIIPLCCGKLLGGRRTVGDFL